MKVLCHVGPWCVKQYSEIARSVSPNSEIVLMSHFWKIDQTGMSKEYYKNLRSDLNFKVESNFSEDDFIKRCRLLRSLPRDNALLHLYAMKKAVSNALERESPDIVISEVIDQYLIDLIKFECDQRGIPFFGLVVSFVNGYFRFTSRGKLEGARDVNKSEVDKVIRQLEQKNYAPNFVSQSSGNFSRYLSTSKKMTSNWARVPYFAVKRIYTKEKYNYHYWASQISAKNNLHIFPALRLGSKNWKDEVRKTNKITIYHPLQMYPEATIEYWCECLEDIEYEKKLVKIIRSMGERFHFLIKEHPNVIGVRAPKLYNTLGALSNVTIVPTHISSNEVSDESSAVLIWTGSAGFEAALRGKPVLTICEPYYMFGDKFKKIDEHTTDDAISNHIDSNSGKLSDVDKYNLVSNLLSGLRPGRYINDASWSNQNVEHLKQALEIGREINGMICKGT